MRKITGLQGECRGGELGDAYRAWLPEDYPRRLTPLGRIYADLSGPIHAA